MAPVGLVCIATARRGFPTSYLQRNYGDVGRDVRECAIRDALAALHAAVGKRGGGPPSH
jgi:nicotinamide mononucleotide (NMN) deamidase PncC